MEGVHAATFSRLNKITAASVFFSAWAATAPICKLWNCWKGTGVITDTTFQVTIYMAVSAAMFSVYCFHRNNWMFFSAKEKHYMDTFWKCFPVAYQGCSGLRKIGCLFLVWTFLTKEFQSVFGTSDDTLVSALYPVVGVLSFFNPIKCLFFKNKNCNIGLSLVYFVTVFI